MKRVLSTFLVIAMLISMVPAVFADETAVVSGTCGKTAAWSFDEASGVLTISGEGAMYDFDAYTACEYEEIKYSVSSVVIEEGITHIGEQAFQYCSMTEISFPSTLTSIGGFAFAKADQLYEIEYNGAIIESIGDNAFYGCWSLENFYVFDPECVISTSAFSEAYPGAIYGYTDSTAETYANTYGIPFNSINGTCGENLIWKMESDFNLVIAPADNALPNKMTEWGGDTWMPWDYFARDIRSATLYDGVENITRYTFTCYENLETITIPASVNMIEEIAIHDCRGLKYINVSSDNANYEEENGVLFTKGMDTIIQYPAGKEETFYMIPDSVTTIAEGAFAYNSNLGAIQIPASVSSITEGAFGIANSLQSITVVDANEYYKSSDGVLYTEDLTGLIAYPAAKQAEYFAVPDHVGWIAADAFNSAEVYGVTFFEGLESIGAYAFANCRNLTEIELPSSLRNIENAAFAYCGMLSSVTIPDGVNYIGKRAFQDCVSLNEITIPASVTEIGADAFDCGSENFVICGYMGTFAETYAMENGLNFTAIDGGTIEPEPVTSGMCGDNVTWMLDELTGTLTIGGEGAMYDFDEDTNPPEYAALRDKISRVVIEDGVTSIGNCAFQYCDAMTEIVLPANLSYIGCFAFAKSGLSNIEYNNCLIDIIGDEAFYGCWNLSEFFVYNSNCSIGTTAFSESGITALVGYTGSTAETYAMENGLNFTSLGGEIIEPEPEPEPEPDNLVFPIEFRFNESTYFNGSVVANVTLTDMSNVSNNVTQTIHFTEKANQYVEFSIPNHTDASKYFVRVMYSGTLDTNINSRVNYFYANNGGLTTVISERAVMQKPTQPIVIYAPQKNTVNGKLSLPEDYWCEDEDAKLTSLWIEICDGADEYIGFAEAEVDENLNYSFELPTNVSGNYTFSVRPVFTKGEEEEIVNPRTNLILKYYDLYNTDGVKQYYAPTTDQSPVYGADFNLESGYVVSGYLRMPDDAYIENGRAYMSVSGYKPENYSEENSEGDYYFEIEYEEGKSDYEWYFAVEKNTEVVIGYYLNLASTGEDDGINSNLLDGVFFSQDGLQVTDMFDMATRYWIDGERSGLNMELQTGRKFSITAHRPEEMNYDAYVYADVEIKSLDGEIISGGTIEIQEGETFGGTVINIPDGYDEVYVMYDVDESIAPDTLLFDLPVYVGSDGILTRDNMEEAMPWNLNDATGVGFTLLLSDEQQGNEFTEEDINAFLTEIQIIANENDADVLFNIIHDNQNIVEATGVDYALWFKCNDDARYRTIEVLRTKINWLAIDLTVDTFVDFFRESLFIGRVTRSESYNEVREVLIQFSDETGRLVSIVDEIENSSVREEIYREALESMQGRDINSVDEIEVILNNSYEKNKNSSTSSGSGGGSGGGGVSLVINAVDSNTLEIIEGVQLFVTNEDESVNESAVSDSEGKAYFPVGSGVYSVQAIADGYQMRNFVVEKSDENFEFTVYMNKNDILQVETNVKEMTYDEIVDAGIDVDAIENKQVYNCTAVLTFSPVGTSSGSASGGSASETITFDYICTDGEVFNAEPVRVGNASICPVAKDIYLIIYSSTTWLKEMFEVQLLVSNTSAIENIEDCVARLELPEGLSLAVMNEELEQQTDNIVIGNIEPNGSADIRWYLCGDAEGEYTIGGTVGGIRVGGGISEEIAVNFSSKEKISVFGGNALNLTIKAEKAATVGEPYAVEYVLQNVSPKDLYNVEINILGGKFLTEYSVEDLTPPNGWTGSMENGFKYFDSTLKSGETLSGIFEVIFAEGIETDYAEYVLSNMFVVAGNGSTVTVPTEIELVDEILTHNWDNGTVTKEATCEEDGEKVFNCTDAGCDDQRIDVVPAKGHDWGEGVITIEPTESSEGERTFSCSRCDATKTEVIPKTYKQEVSFLVDDITYTYGDRTAVYHYAYNDSEDGGELTYSSSNENVATVDYRGKVTIHNAGEATIIATAAAVPGKYVETSASYKLIINKAQLNIRPNEIIIYYGENVPDCGYSVEGLVNNETERVAIKGKAVYDYSYRRYDSPGRYTVSISGLQARNYDIVYEVGDLIVERNPDHEIEIGNLTQRKGSVTPVTAQTIPMDATAQINIEYQLPDGTWQTNVPTEIGEYVVRATLVYSDNIEVPYDGRYTEDILTIKAGAMIDVGGDTGGVDVGIEDTDEKVEIIVSEDALTEVIDNIPETGEVVIDVKGNGEKKELVLPSNLVGALNESEAAKEVTVIADDTEISVSPDALKTVAEKMEENDKIGISIGAVEKDNLNEEQQKALDAISKDAVVLSLNMVVSKYDSEGQKVSEEKLHEFNGKVNVRAAYEMPGEKDGQRVIVCYVSDNGSVTYIRADYKDKYVEFETDHFSHFAIMSVGGEPGVNVSLRTTEENWHFDNITIGDYEGAVVDGTIYVGIYNEQNVLLGAATEDFTFSGTDSVSVEKIAGAEYAVVYVWEKGTMKPLTDKPKKIDL